MDRSLGATNSLDSLTQLITAGSYAAGMFFSAASIEQLKMHSDNPTAVPVGNPVALMFVAAALAFASAMPANAGE